MTEPRSVGAETAGQDSARTGRRASPGAALAPTPTESGPPLLHLDGRVATITLRRPEHANRLGPADLAVLAAHLRAVDADEAVTVLRVAALGKHFCSGFDIGSIGKAVSGCDDLPPASFEDVTDALENTRAVSIAAIQGGVFGGATDLALACDFRYGVPACRMFVPAARLGMHYYGGGLERFVRRLGLAAAKRIMLTAETFDAQAMLTIGYLDRLLDSPQALIAEVEQLTATLTGMAPLALLGMKKHLNRIALGRLDADEIAADIARASASADLAEGARAWLEKRTPRFQGR
ncbi:MAG: enoyl-CoA hydratase/isomerase family protein [Burkholderiaceae bacterium]